MGLVPQQSKEIPALLFTYSLMKLRKHLGGFNKRSGLCVCYCQRDILGNMLIHLLNDMLDHMFDDTPTWVWSREEV